MKLGCKKIKVEDWLSMSNVRSVECEGGVGGGV